MKDKPNPKALIILCLLLATLPYAEAATYYVSTSGNDSNTGLSQALAWRTMTYAGTKASAGDTVYIKAGDYGAENVVFSNSGNATSPIRFIGYKSTPEDIAEPEWIDLDNWSQYSAPTLNSSEMPLLSGNGEEHGIYVNTKNYIEIRNIQVTDYYYAFEAYKSSHIDINNVIATAGSTGYQGLWFYTCQYCSIKNSVAAEFDMANIEVAKGSNHSLVENCRAHEAMGGMKSDYFIVVSRGGHNITIRHNLAMNMQDTGCHGIGLKGGGGEIYDCTVEDNVAVNVNRCFYVAHPGVYNNTFINDTAIDNDPNMSFNGYTVRIGPHDNQFIDCKAYGMYAAIKFYDNTEDLSYTPVYPHSWGSLNNTFTNCLFNDSHFGVYFHSNELPSPSYNNTIKNCVFSGGHTLEYHETSNNTGNVIKDSIVTGFSYHRRGSGTGPNISYTYTDFYNNTFSMLPGTGNIASDPVFAGGGDYHLKSQYGRWNGSSWVNDAVTSPCIDAGDPSSDYSNEPAPNGNRVDMGIYGNTAQASKSASGATTTTTTTTSTTTTSTTTSTTTTTTTTSTTSTTTSTSSTTTTTSTSTTTTTSTSTTLAQCGLVGDYPPCGAVTLEEVVDLIDEWTQDAAQLSQVIDLINAWATQ